MATGLFALKIHSKEMKKVSKNIILLLCDRMSSFPEKNMFEPYLHTAFLWQQTEWKCNTTRKHIGIHISGRFSIILDFAGEHWSKIASYYRNIVWKI